MSRDEGDVSGERGNGFALKKAAQGKRDERGKKWREK